jgi:copper resistance protein D
LAAPLRRRFAWITWVCLALCLLSGATWLLFTAASMSGQPLPEVYAQGVLWTVLSQTDFGNDWLLRLACGCILAVLSVPLLSASGAKSFWLKGAAVIAAAGLAGSLAWAGHANGAQGLEGIVHPVADFLHLIAAAAWVGALVPLAMLLSMGGEDGDTLAIARTATSRFSTLGIVSVATLLLTGSINTWYLVGSVPALTESTYGRLLLIKIVLFLVMAGIAAFNWSQLTPRLVQNADGAVAQKARWSLRRNAAVEALFGAVIIGIVAVLGTLPPGSHAHHHEVEEVVPPDASFQHIHSERGMADVIIEPGRVGTARVTIHLLNDDLETLTAQAVTLTLAAPNAAAKPITRTALQSTDGRWHVDGVTLTEPGNWIVTVDVLLGPDNRLQLVAPIVIDPRK